jgi:CheY-like chemotaxis protein
MQILVVDDEESFVRTTVQLLKRAGLAAIGCTSPDEFTRRARSGEFRNVSLMLFDMKLGEREDLSPITAVDLMPVARTYTPSAKILIFTHGDISVEDCIRCVQLGALGLIPKFKEPEQLLIAARVYGDLGDPHRAREETIRELRLRLDDKDEANKGQLFEMLVANILSSVDGMTLVGNNLNKPVGEIIVECKNRKEPPETSDFSVFMAKVQAKNGCRVGIMVSWLRASSGFRILQQTHPPDAKMLTLHREELDELIEASWAERTNLLTAIFQRQL